MFDLPLSSPISIIAVLFLMFWFVPLISHRIKAPSIILLIIFAIIIGPNGLNFIKIDENIKMLSDIGIMFIMFLAGSELDANKIRTNKRNTIIFGTFSFIIPFAFGFAIFYLIFAYSLVSAIVIGLMFSTQTLVSFPTVSRLGLTNNRSVISAIGGTIIADATVLFLIGLLISLHNGVFNVNYILKLLLLLVVFFVLVGIIFPLIVKTFFRNYEENDYSHFSLIMALMFLAGVIANLVGLESIIGAFFVGVILNKYIPNNSALRQYLHFTGNAIFIPVFLFYVGLLIDYKSVISSGETLIIATVLIFSAIISKFIAAWISGKLLNFSKYEILLLFGLSTSRAAVVITTALIGFNIGIININFLNAIVVLVLISCVVSSYVTEFCGKKVVIAEQSLMEKSKIDAQYEKIIVPYSNPATVDKLLDIAVATTYPNPRSIIYPLSVIIEDDKRYKETITVNESKINELAERFYSKEINFTPISRLDVNYISGINRASKELLASMIILGWAGKLRKGDVLGKNIDAILSTVDIQIMVCHISLPINIFDEMLIIVPEYAQFEKGFRKWMHSIDAISRNIVAKVTFICKEEVHFALKKSSEEWKINLNANFVIKNSFIEAIAHLQTSKNKNALILFIFARDRSVSAVESIINYMRNDELWLKQTNNNFVFLIPEQFPSGELH